MTKCHIYSNQTVSLMETKQEYLNRIFRTASLRGMCKSQRDFASLLGVNEKAFSSALNGNERYLTDNLVAKVRLFAKENELEQLAVTGETEETVLVIPYEARGGTIGDFVQGVHDYDCERITSPIKGADYAMEVTGDSMSPEYPSGSRVLIKKIDPEQFVAWNEVYVLDTPNGAVIKRVRKTDDPKIVECVSVNPAYQSYTIPREFIRGWYRVLMVMSLK